MPFERLVLQQFYHTSRASFSTLLKVGGRDTATSTILLSLLCLCVEWLLPWNRDDILVIDVETLDVVVYYLWVRLLLPLFDLFWAFSWQLFKLWMSGPNGAIWVILFKRFYARLMDRLLWRVGQRVVHCREPRIFLSYLLCLAKYLVFGTDILATAGVSARISALHEWAFYVLVGAGGNLL